MAGAEPRHAYRHASELNRALHCPSGTARFKLGAPWGAQQGQAEALVPARAVYTPCAHPCRGHAAAAAPAAVPAARAAGLGPRGSCAAVLFSESWPSCGAAVARDMLASEAMSAAVVRVQLQQRLL